MNAMEWQGADKLLTRLRHLVVCALMLLYVQPAFADTRVQVSVPGQDSLKFLVSVSTHHADLHNGYSRVRFQNLLHFFRVNIEPAGNDQFLAPVCKINVTVIILPG